MSIALDTDDGVEKNAYDQQFDDNHTVRDQKVSTCTYGGRGLCHTCA